MSANKVINFMGARMLAAALSIALVLGSIASLAVNGLQFGLDFTGGTLVELGYDRAADLQKIRDDLGSAGFKDSVVQDYGSATDVLIRLTGDDPKLGDKVVDTLQAGYSGQIDLRRVEFVGPQVGEELREQGGLGMLLALALVMVYIAIRFQYKFAIGAVVALAHDVIITLGVFSILGVGFDLTVLAAVLSVIGYSLNDTIVVSDRIRENFRKMRKGTEIEIINASLTQTFGRTIITSLTTIMVLVALFYFGGEMIHAFALALLIGVGVGTYSSIYVAANILLFMDITREDLLPPQKEEDEADQMP
ncbi:protein translocase subunit SecF [Aestuariirhabdus litorea]|uniref:Protein-export membrane protein SecF n=1 Tax=Aestuariirhabdus litorea TaxID=2528527 RepID=A0A3P3VUJ6_9GAMM|nr:protein translocase subunit SecF [Aestuariirhabdus litorea]RRJ85296.1 protein translocase subunit SecF [Aestuariirhabdus litorea]RWW98518.1 protein translocase subunit SecF [Endozoicomonadaceae bacterium GTF-13]